MWHKKQDNELQNAENLLLGGISFKWTMIFLYFAVHVMVSISVFFLWEIHKGLQDIRDHLDQSCVQGE